MWEHGCSEGLFFKTLFKRRGRREGEKERDRQISRFIVLEPSNAEKFKAKKLKITQVERGGPVAQ